MTAPDRALFDPGLQPERTELAWQRTAIAIGVGSLVLMRYLPDAFAHPAWLVPGAVGVLAAAAFWIAARGRYDRVSAAAIAEGDRARLPDGLLPLLLGAFATAAGVLGLLVVLLAR